MSGHKCPNCQFELAPPGFKRVFAFDFYNPKLTTWKEEIPECGNAKATLERYLPTMQALFPGTFIMMLPERPQGPDPIYWRSDDPTLWPNQSIWVYARDVELSKEN